MASRIYFIPHKHFTHTQMLSYANQLTYPVVIKPLEGTGGKGVITKIANDEELKKAIHYVKEILNIQDKLLIEKHFEGNDYRLYVIGDKVVAAYKRYPLHVVGNGINTISELLEEKEKIRKNNPSLVTRPIKIDEETIQLLKKRHYTMESIPVKNEVVELKSKNNVTAGGEAVDMTDQISDKMQKIAVRAIQSIPSMVQGGVDMMIDEENDSGVVIEINSRPHITAHLYPAQGESRDVPAAIIDYFFPETVDYNKGKRRNMYFDFNSIFEKTYIENSMEEVKVKRIPGDIILKRYQLEMPDQKKNFQKWLQSSAKKTNISGFTKEFPKHLSIVFAGREKDIEKLYQDMKRKLSGYKFKTVLEEKRRLSPVQQGFYILENENENVKKVGKDANREDYEGNSYQENVDRLIKAVQEKNRDVEAYNSSNEEYKVLKEQVRSLQDKLNKYEHNSVIKTIKRKV